MSERELKRNGVPINELFYTNTLNRKIGVHNTNLEQKGISLCRIKKLTQNMEINPSAVLIKNNRINILESDN